MTGQLYALKILEKSHLIRNNKMHVAIAERNALAALGGGHPGIVRLHSTFQDECRLCACTNSSFLSTQPPLTYLDFVLDLARNGEMKSLLTKLGSLSLPCTRYYAAQLVDTIEYMHSKGVIHRYSLSSLHRSSMIILNTLSGISSPKIYCSMKTTA